MSDAVWLFVGGYQHTIEYCSFEGKTTLNTTVAFTPTEATSTMDTPRNHVMRFNYFGSRTVIGGNGYEGIRIGDSSRQGYNMASTFEFNYFYRTIYGPDANAEPEVISNKSKGNVYRYNTFFDNKGQLTVRHGDDCLIEGNFFFGNGLSRSGGVRLVGQNHVVRNNYFQDVDGTSLNSAIVVMKATATGPSRTPAAATSPRTMRVFITTPSSTAISRLTSAPTARAALLSIRRVSSSRTTSCRARPTTVRSSSSTCRSRTSRLPVTSSTIPPATTASLA